MGKKKGIICQALVTVLGLCVSAQFRPLRVKVSPENDTNASSRQDKENKTGDFLKNAPFKSYGVTLTAFGGIVGSSVHLDGDRSCYCYSKA